MVLDIKISAHIKIEMMNCMCHLIENPGIELVEDRLSRSGLAYVLLHDIINFTYDIKIGAPE
jgi:hypothetical protein